MNIYYPPYGMMVGLVASTPLTALLLGWPDALQNSVMMGLGAWTLWICYKMTEIKKAHSVKDE